MSINDRIASFVNSKKIKKGELATLLDITPQTISNILGGKVNPSSSFLIGIATKFYDLDTRWLLTGDGEMFNDYIAPREDYEIRLEACEDLCKILKKQLDDKDLQLRDKERIITLLE